MEDREVLRTVQMPDKLDENENDISIYSYISLSYM